MKVKNIVDAYVSQYNQGDQTAQQTAIVTTRYGRVTVGPTYTTLPSDVFLQVMKCLNGLETIQALRTCKHFLAMSYTKCFWKTVCKLQSSYLQSDPFESLIESQTQSEIQRESAYHKLYQLRLRGKEPWVEKLLVGSQWFQPAYRQCGRAETLPNGNILLVYSNTLYSESAGSLWSPSGQHLTELGDSSPFHKIEFLPDGFITLSDMKVCIWSFTGVRLVTHIFDWWSVSCIVALPNGTIVMGYQDCKVRVWSRNFELLLTLEGHTKAVTKLAVRPDGGFVSASGDCTAIVWSAEGERLATLTSDTDLLMDDRRIPECLRSVCIRRLTTFLMVLTNGNIITWWSREERTEREGRVWSPDGRLLARLPRFASASRIAASPNGGFVAAREDQIDFYSFSKGFFRAVVVPTKSTSCMEVSATDGRVIAFSFYDKIMRIWSPHGKLLATFKNKSDVQCITWLSNGDILAGYIDASARVWRMDAKPLLREDRDFPCVLSIFTNKQNPSSSCAIS